MSSSNEIRQSSAGDRHGWNSLNHYLDIHLSILEHFSDFFIEHDGLEIRLPVENTMTIRGRIHCQHGLFLDVNKTLALNDRGQVRTIRYSYHACIDDTPPQSIFRYDNAHVYVREGHTDAHHKHIFDSLTGEELTASPEWVGYERWPTLADVLNEMYDRSQAIRRGINTQGR